ncbi:RsbRD N-terminal domain-containing protein [bacterium]|nr:RsbRD N-terminal domain-containing protein [bacterium]
MSLADLLKQKQSAILERWLNLILDTYPGDASVFLKKQKNRFANPVGYTLTREVDVLFQVLLAEIDSETLSTSLDNIIRIRSVQEFSPSQAVGFIFFLKRAIREELDGEILEDALSGELLEIESRIDRLALTAFDSYMKCRERLHKARSNELKRKTNIIISRFTSPDSQPGQENEAE